MAAAAPPLHLEGPAPPAPLVMLIQIIGAEPVVGLTDEVDGGLGITEFEPVVGSAGEADGGLGIVGVEPVVAGVEPDVAGVEPVVAVVEPVVAVVDRAVGRAEAVRRK